ncbi:MAG: outer membrane protein assembly factor BamB family protein, partial [Planctomycetota bacterium]
MSCRIYSVVVVAVGLSVACGPVIAAEAPPEGSLAAKVGVSRGLVAVLGVPEDDPKQIVNLASGGGLMLYVQCPDAESVADVRKAAEAAGMLGRRIYAERGPLSRIHLAGNLVDAVIVADGAKGVKWAEVMRVLRPGGGAIRGDEVALKPPPAGMDDWSHPYHGPDNNPQSADKVARAPYLTHFLAKPMFSSQPEVTVAAGGRIFKAFGHIAFREYQNKMINTLIAMSAYNGTILWRRKLTPGYMIHRNCMIATPETLYMADAESCKLIDAATGELTGQIAPPVDIAGGTVWKWMALRRSGKGDPVLYAMLGGPEAPARVKPGRAQGVAGWPWGMWPGYDYKDEKAGWGFGKAFVAMDAVTGQVLWDRKLEHIADSRGVCMNGDKIFFYCRGKRLSALSVEDGSVAWETSDAKLLKAIGPDFRAQSAHWGFATSAYTKCNDEVVVFAGPQRTNLVAVSAADGKLLWQKTPPGGPGTNTGNCQLVLRKDALYAMNPRGSQVIDYMTGRVIKRTRGRQACTRATGSVDSIFFRGRGTVRWDLASNKVEHIAPMRPACHDGVVISNGMLYWGPWICGCSLSLFGVACLEPAGDFDFKAARAEAGQLVWDRDAPVAVAAARDDPADWPAFRRDSGRSGVTGVAPPAKVAERWTFRPAQANAATAPVAANGFVYVGGSDGVVRAISARDGSLKWKAYTGGAVNFPPAIAEGRAYVGSCDGWVRAYVAATGNRIWKFRVAPVERRIPLYGQLASTWPVAGGVVVDRGTV